MALAPGEIALRRGGTSDAQVKSTPDRSLAGLLPLIDEALADPAWQAREIEVVVSQQFVRHVLTPPPHKSLSHDEERELVAGSFEAIYGEISADWRIDVISQPPRYGLVGAAMDNAFLDSLEAMLARLGIRRIAVRPAASVAARRLPRHFSGWWALVEPGWLSLFAGSGPIWHHAVAQPIAADWTAALSELVAHEAGLVPLAESAGLWVQTVGADLPVSARDDVPWTLLPQPRTSRGAPALLDL